MTKHELWQEEAKRVGGEHFIAVIEDMRGMQSTTLTRLEEMNKQTALNTQNIAALQNAFPANDTEGHRRYHQLIIDNTEAKRALTKAIKEKTISGIIWSLVVWGASEAWTYLPKIWGAIK